MPRGTWPVAVSVGGLGSSSGAGVSVDLVVGRLMRVHFYTVPSVLVAESPDEVYGVELVPVGWVVSTLRRHLGVAGAVRVSLLG